MKPLDLTEEVDHYCLTILRALLSSFRWLRFNELYRKVETQMSKPTFVKHIKHLEEQDLIVRKVEGRQKTTILFNWRKIFGDKDNLQDAMKISKNEDVLDRSTQYDALSLEERLTPILLSMFENNIKTLRIDVLNAIDPSTRFLRDLQKMVYSQTQHLYWKWLIKDCSNNKEYGKKVLDKLTELKKKFQHRLPPSYKELLKRTPDLLF